VYNSTCEWQFAPPFSPELEPRAPPDVPREKGAIVVLCCADAQELQDLLYMLQARPDPPVQTGHTSLPTPVRTGHASLPTPVQTGHTSPRMPAPARAQGTAHGD
jgi:hypothetical protein